jgi:hypothetical protein
MQTVWDMFAMLEGDFGLILGTLGLVLVAAAGVYGVYLAWRKYRMAVNKI